MSAQGVYKVTEDFEKAICNYTGAPYAIAVDCCSHAIFLALKFENVEGKIITIPNRTFVSVPCEIIHAGAKVRFYHIEEKGLTGGYRLKGSNVWDCALSFTTRMYIPGTHMCVSFSGPQKHLPLIKGGAILTDNKEAYKWFKQARTSGRHEQSYFTDNFEIIGWNYYMMPEVAARGLMLMRRFYTECSTPKPNPDIYNEYPDLSKFKCYGG